jgi:SMC interacting uncharacterized protein involved in chromosome segregation
MITHNYFTDNHSHLTLPSTTTLRCKCSTSCLKKLSQINSFQTLGTLHSWPSVLGVLHYLAQRAQAIHVRDVSILEKFFPNTDEHGFEKDSGESEDKIVYEFNRVCYKAFLNGEEDYDAYHEDLRHRLEVSSGDFFP